MVRALLVSTGGEVFTCAVDCLARCFSGDCTEAPGLLADFLLAAAGWDGRRAGTSGSDCCATFATAEGLEGEFRLVALLERFCLLADSASWWLEGEARGSDERNVSKVAIKQFNVNIIAKRACTTTNLPA